MNPTGAMRGFLIPHKPSTQTEQTPLRICVHGAQHELGELGWNVSLEDIPISEISDQTCQAAHELVGGGSLHHFLLIIDFVFTKVPEVLDMI